MLEFYIRKLSEFSEDSRKYQKVKKELFNMFDSYLEDYCIDNKIYDRFNQELKKFINKNNLNLNNKKSINEFRRRKLNTEEQFFAEMISRFVNKNQFFENKYPSPSFDPLFRCYLVNSGDLDKAEDEFVNTSEFNKYIQKQGFPEKYNPILEKNTLIMNL